MVFTMRRSATRGIEIPQTGVAQSLGAVRPMEDALDEILRFAVGTARHDAFVGGDGDANGIVEEIRGRGENEAFHPVVDRRGNQVHRVADALAEVFERVLDRLAHQGVGGEVHDRIRRHLVHDPVDGGFVLEIDLIEGGVRMDGSTVALIEIIEDGHFMAGSEEGLDGDASDVSGSAGDEDFHWGINCERKHPAR